MNSSSSSHFMDKQIMGLAGAGGGELIDLTNPEEDRRHVSSSNGGGGGRLLSSGLPALRSNSLEESLRRSWDTRSASTARNSLEPRELVKVNHEKDIVAEIDQTVKKYVDNLLRALEGLSPRLSQLESRTRHLESSVNDLKDTIGNNCGSTDGMLRNLENILREVQTGVQLLRDKQEIAEAQLQLSKLKQSSLISDRYKSQPGPSAVSVNQSGFHTQQQPPLPCASPSPAVAPQQLPPPLSYPIAPPSPQPPPAHQNLAPQIPVPNAPSLTHQNPPPQFLAQLSQPQFTPLPSLPREPTYHSPAVPQPMQTELQSHPQSQHPPQPPPYQVPQYLQQIPPPQSVNPSSQIQSSMPRPEESAAPYMPLPPQSQTYPQSIHQPGPIPQPPQYYGSGQLPHPSSYAPPSGPSFSESYPYGGSSSHYSSTIKSSPFSDYAPTSGENYSRLPTVKILPHALPITEGASSGSGSGNKVPIDDVVDRVVTMGFSREQVRATVRKLKENGQSLDLNVVLDKLMNDGGR